MDDTKKISTFHNDSSQCSPRPQAPQASSTLVGSEKTSSHLEENTLLEEKNKVSSKSSSLGVLDVDSVSGLITDNDSRLSLKERFSQFEKMLEEERRKSRSHISKRLEQLSATSGDLRVGEDVPSEARFSATYAKNDAEYLKKSASSVLKNGLQTSRVNETEEFLSSSQARLKLEKDQKANKNEFNSLPISEAEFSVESDEYATSGATDYLKAGSYMPSELRKILRSETYTKQEIDKNIHNSLVKGTSYDESLNVASGCVSSVSSMAILEMLQNSSFEPVTLAERLLTKGASSKPKSSQCDTTNHKPMKSSASVMSRMLPEDSSSEKYSKQNFPSRKQIALEQDTFSDSPGGKNNLLASKMSSQVISQLRCQYPKCTPEKGFYKLVKTKSDFEICDAADNSSECSTASSYVCLMPSQNGTNGGHLEDPDATVTSPLTANLVKLSRINSCTSVNVSCSSSITVDPVKEVTTSCEITCSGNSKSTEDSDSSVLNIGPLCIGTQVKVVLTVANPVGKILNYRMKLSSIQADGKMCLNAASVMISALVLTASPYTETEVSIVVTPLVCGEISIVLEFVNEEKSFSNIIRNINIVGIIPSLEMIHPEDCSIHYGLLPECSQKMLPIRFANNNPVRLPLKILIYEDYGSIADLTYVAKVIVEPNSIFECAVMVSTPEVAFEYDKDSTNVIDVGGTIKIVIDTVQDSHLCVLSTVSLNAKVGSTMVHIQTPLPLKLMVMDYPQFSASNELHIKNSGVIPMDVKAKLCNDEKKEFSVQPCNFHLASFSDFKVKIHFKPITTVGSRKVEMHLTLLNSAKHFIVPLLGIVEEPVVSSTTSIKDVTPLPQPRCSGVVTYGSSSGSGAYEEGSLDLACTHTSLSWSDTAIHTKRVQTATLRNKNNHREKLVLSLTDNLGSFKLVENDSYVKEMKLTLEANETCKIGIAFIPYIPDKQASGRVKIYRHRCLDSSTAISNKRVLPLYGYGGDAKISIQNVFRDSEGRIWLNPDLETLEAKFVVENIGDSVAFLKIVQQEPDDVMFPEEAFLLPEENIEVTFKLRLTTERVELLSRQNHSKDMIVLNKLLLFHGSEATRQRIRRLWLKQGQSCPDTAIKRLGDKLDAVCDIAGSCDSVDVTELQDHLTSLSKLWYEGIQEEAIGILIDKDSLESLSLDSTVIFKDLDTTIVHPRGFSQ